MRSMCFCTARDRTIFSRSLPLFTRSCTVSLCVMRTTSCSMMGPASSSVVVAGCTDNLHAALEGCVIGLGSYECGQEGVVYVDDAVGVGIDHPFGNHLHVACQHDEVHVVLGQQLHLQPFLLLLCLLGDGEEVEGDAEPLGHVLQVGVVADDERNLHVPFAGCVACQQVEQAVRHFGDEDGHPRFLVREVEAEAHVVLLCIECGEVVVNLLLWNQEILQFPLDAHEEDVLHMVYVLVQVDNVPLVHRNKVRHLRQYARFVGAVEQQFSCFHHSFFVLSFKIIPFPLFLLRLQGLLSAWTCMGWLQKVVLTEIAEIFDTPLQHFCFEGAKITIYS